MPMRVDLLESTRCGASEVVIGAELDGVEFEGAVLGARGGALLDGRGMGVEGRGGALFAARGGGAVLAAAGGRAVVAAASGGALFTGVAGGALATGVDARGGALLDGRGIGVEGRAAAGG